MDITSVAGAYTKLFVPLLPFIRKVFFYDSFFSLSDEKKAEGMSFLNESVKKRDALDKYQQELKFREFKMTGSLELNDYVLRFYLSDRVKREGFCKALFGMKGLYDFLNNQLLIKKQNILFLVFILLSGFFVGGVTFLLVSDIYIHGLEWSHNRLDWLTAGLASVITLQFILNLTHFLISLRRLKRHVTEFNIFISLLRIKRALQQ